MRVTYFTLEPMQVGDDLRGPGDLVPEAAAWKWLDSYVREGRLAPVLVATLPAAVQEQLAAWEAHQQEMSGAGPDDQPVLVPPGTTPDTTTPAEKAST